MSEASVGVGPASHLPAARWRQMGRVLPPPNARKQEGRPRQDDRQAMTASVSGVRPGGPWHALPRRVGAASTGPERGQAWREAQVCARLWQAGLLTEAPRPGLEGAGQARDGAMPNAPLGGRQRSARPPPLAASSGPHGAC
jgi:hypothetical protein